MCVGVRIYLYPKLCSPGRWTPGEANGIVSLWAHRPEEQES